MHLTLTPPLIRLQRSSIFTSSIGGINVRG